MAVRRAERVLYEVVDGTAVLVDPESPELISLNRVGSLVWTSLDGITGVDELADHLLPRFPGITQDQLVRDIEAFLDELREIGLVDDIES